MPNPSNSSYTDPSYEPTDYRGPDFEYRNPLQYEEMIVPIPSPQTQAVPIIPTDDLPAGFVPQSITPAVSAQPLPDMTGDLPAGFVPHSVTPAAPSQPLPDMADDLPAGFVPHSVTPAAPTQPLPGMSEDLPVGFVPHGFTPAAHTQALPGMNGLPPGFIPHSATPAVGTQALPEMPPLNDFPVGFVPMSAAPSNAPLPAMPEPNGQGRSPSLSDALPTMPRIPGQFPDSGNNPSTRSPRPGSAMLRAPSAVPVVLRADGYGRTGGEGPVVPPLVDPSAYGGTFSDRSGSARRQYTSSQGSQGHRRTASMAPSIQRAPSPRPSLGGVPIVPSTGSGAGVGRSYSMREGSANGRSPMPAYMTFPNSGMPPHGNGLSGPVVPGLPPEGLRTPYSRRMGMEPEYNAGGGRYPGEPNSPNLSSFSHSTRPSNGARRARLPEAALGGESPRNSRVYPRTPHTRPPGLDEGPVGPVVPEPLDRPILGFTNRDPELQRPLSRMSNKSYKSFDADSYVDPAILASGESTLLKNRKSSGSGFGGGWD